MQEKKTTIIICGEKHNEKNAVKKVDWAFCMTNAHITKGNSATVAALE